MSGSAPATVDEAASFVDKFRARWPEWGIARSFVPAHQRDTAEHWFALLQEWTDAAATAEPAPGLAKLAWWQEELHGWAKGARRHPLGSVLQSGRADWHALAEALPGLMRREAGFDPAAIDRFARALDAAERVLFQEDREGWTRIVQELRLALGLSTLVDVAGSDATRPRRILGAIAAGRRDGRLLSPWRTLWCSWRAARAAPMGKMAG